GFTSDANNLVPGDTNLDSDVFVHDRQNGTTTRVSVSSAGVQGHKDSNLATLAGNGRFVAFDSYASNLVPGDTNGERDVFLHDLEIGQTTRLSVDSNGVEGDGESVDASICADGHLIAFTSFATNLVAGDTNGSSDVF